MKQKKNLIIKLFLIATLILGMACAVKVNGATVERVIAENTILKWYNKELPYSINRADFRGTYTKADYTVEHYKETTNGNYAKVTEDTEIKSGVVGEDGEYAGNIYVGYVYQPDLTEPENKAILIDGSLVIKLYYNKRTDLTYIVNHYYEDREELNEQETYENQTYRDIVTDEDIELILKNGFVFGRIENTPLYIEVDLEGNIIDVYYYKSIMEYTKTSKIFNLGVEIPNPEFVHEGNTIKYTITAENKGRGDEKNIVITDTIDLRLLNYISATSGGKGELTEENIDANTLQIIWSGDIDSGDIVNIEIEVRIKTLEEYENGFTIDRNIAYVEYNGEDPEPIEDDKDYEVGKANIIGEKTSIVYNHLGIPTQRGTDVFENDIIIYTVVLENIGNEAGEITATVTDILEIDALQYIKSEATKGTIDYNALTGKLIWTVQIEAHETVTIDIEMRVRELPPLSNNLAINKNIADLKVNDEEKDPLEDDKEYIVKKPEINITKTSTVYNYNNDEVTKTGNTTIIHEGDIIVYNILVENTGNEEHFVEISDQIDLGPVDYISSSLTGAGNLNYNTITGELTWSGVMAGKSTAEIVITVKTKNVPEVLHQISIDNNILNVKINELEKDPVEDEDDYIVAKTDITGIKSSIVYNYLDEEITTNFVHEGDLIAYTIEITNNGIAEEKGVIITDSINTEILQYINSTSLGKGNITWNAVTGILKWEGDLNPGETVTIIIEVEVNAIPDGVLSVHIGKNVAGLKANNEDREDIEDPEDYTAVKSNVIGNKTSIAYYTGTNTEIPKTSAFVHVGDTIIYTITLENAGIAPETSVLLMDPINTYLIQRVSETATIGTVLWNGAESRFEWSGTLNSGEIAVIKLTVIIQDVDGSQIYAIDRNIANLTINGEEKDPIEDEEEYYVAKLDFNTLKTSKVYDHDLNILPKTSGTTTIHEGYVIEYEIRLSNDGSEAIQIDLEDEIQTDVVQYITSVATSGTVGYNPITGKITWSGIINAGEDLKIFITVKAKDVPTGQASVTLNNNIVDVLINGEDEEEIEDEDDYIIVKTDISASKTSIVYDYLDEVVTGTNYVHEGDKIIYTIQATNNGMVKETGVVITDNINITALQYITSNANIGAITWNSVTGELKWTGDLNSGETLEITIEVEVKPIPETTAIIHIGQNIAGLRANNEDKEDIEDPEDYTAVKPNVISSKTSTAYYAGTTNPIPASAEFVHEGDTIVYTITLENAGLAPEKGIQIMDPVNTTLLQRISETSTKGTVTWNGTLGRFEWSGTLNPGETAEITLTLQIKEVDASQVYIIEGNIASLKVNGEDKDPIEDEKEYHVAKAELDFTKTSRVFDHNLNLVPKTGGTTTIHEGYEIEYAITLSNNGSETAKVEITDQLQTTVVEYVDSAVSDGTLDYNPVTGEISWVGTINAGEEVIILIVVKAKDVPNGETSTLLSNNIVDVLINDEEEDEIEDEDDYIIAKTIIDAQKSSIVYDYLNEVVTGTNYIHEGDRIIYTITATNNGIAEEKGVTITDYIKITALNYITSSANIGAITWSAVTGELKWTGDLTPGETVTITIEVEVKEIPEGLTSMHIGQNIAGLRANNEDKEDIEDPEDYTAVKPNITGNKVSTAYYAGTTNPIPPSAGFIHEGDRIVYTITLKNEGLAPEKSIVVFDPIDTNVIKRISETASIGTVSWNGAQSRFEWVGDLQPGETIVIVLTVEVQEVESSQVFVVERNIARIEVNGKEKDPVEDEEDYIVGKVGFNAIKTSKIYDHDLNLLSKTGETTIIHEGYTIIYTIALSNEGGIPAEIEITDQIQIGVVEYVMSTASDGTLNYNSITGALTWEGIIEHEEEVIITVIVKAKDVPNGQLSTKVETNIVDVVLNGEPDDEIEDDSDYIIAKTIIDAQKSSTLRDYTGTLISDTDDVHEGDTITYTITATNNGIAIESGIVITDEINITALQYVSSSSGGKGVLNWNSVTGILTWEGTLNPTETVNITITVTVKELPATLNQLHIGQNVANLKANEEDKEDIEDPRDYTVKKPNVIINKSSVAYEGTSSTAIPGSAPFIHEGDTIVYTITLQNAGTIRERNITITDPINTTLLQRVSETATIGTVTWNNTSGRFEWTGTLNPGQTAVIELTVRVRTVASQPNGFNIAQNVATTRVNGVTDTVTDPDSYVVGKYNISGTKASQAYDIEGNTISRTNLYELETIDYTITLNNSGNEPGVITLRDPLPSGLVIISSLDLTSGEIANLTSSGGLSVTVPAGGTKIIRFTARVEGTPGTNIRNSVTVNGGTPIQDSKTYQITAPTITLSKSTASVNGLKYGDKIVYTLTLKLTNGNIARNVVIRDAIPTGTILSDLMDADRVEGGNVVFEIGDIVGNGTEIEVSFEVEVSVNNQNGTNSNQTQITNTANAISSSISGQVNSNTLTLELERYSNVPINKRLWEENWEEDIILYPHLYAASGNVQQNATLTLQAYTPSSQLVCTAVVTRVSKRYTSVVITLNNGVGQTITVEKIRSVYQGSANLGDPAGAFANNPGNIWDWYINGVYNPAPSTYGDSGTGNDAFFIDLENVRIHTNNWIHTYQSGVAVPGNTFKVQITGTTDYGAPYSDTIIIPAGGVTSFADVPYGNYTVTEIDMAGNPITAYDVLIRTNNTPPAEGFTPSQSINISVGGTTPTVYINNIEPMSP